MKSAVSRRYAKALFAIARDKAILEPTAEELMRLGTAAANEALQPVVRSPLLSASRRTELANILITELNLSDLLSRFVRLLADRQRLAELPGIADFYLRLLDEEKGRVRVAVRTAVELNDTDQKQLIDAFARLTGKEVIPTVTVDPDLLGGVVVEAQGKVYDGSVRAQLDRIADRLTGEARF
jgi:F-type H+-transporting ATPase subunit delta